MKRGGAEPPPGAAPAAGAAAGAAGGVGPGGGAAEGIVFRWDLDKTYLQTDFESLRKLVRIPFESAADKVHLPGVPQLIRGLRQSAVGRGERPWVFFLSASPPQIGAAIREKLALDGIEYDGITFKDQLRNLRRLRFRSLREQIGYKLGELLESRRRGPAARREVLFGDDWESDPLVYSLYADVLAGVVDVAALGALLERLEVERSAARRAVRAAEALAAAGPARVVERIYINLERRTPPSRFHVFGPRLVPAFNYFQTGASLFESGLLDESPLTEIAAVLVEQSGYTGVRLRNSLDDLVRRGHLLPATRTRILQSLVRAGLAAPETPGGLWAWLRAVAQRWWGGPGRRRKGARRRRRVPQPATFAIDYASLLRDWARRG